MLFNSDDLKNPNFLVSFELMNVCIHCSTAMRTFKPFTIDNALYGGEDQALFTGGVCPKCNFTLVKTPVPMPFVHRMQEVKNQTEFALVMADLKSWLDTVYGQVEEKVNKKRLLKLD